MSRRSGLMGGAVVAAMVLSGCSGGDDDFSVVGSIERLPDVYDGGPVMITLGDLDAAAEILELDRDAMAEEQRSITFLLSASFEDGNEAAFVPVPGNMVDSLEAAEELGWGYADIGLYAEVVSLDGPPTYTISVAPREGAELGLEQMTEVGDGIYTLGEGDDGHSVIGEATALRQIGAPLRGAEQDGYTYVSNYTPPIEQVLDDGDSLADHSGLAGVAERLDEYDVYSAALVGRRAFPPDPMQLLGPGASPDELEAVMNAMEDELIQRPFTSVGIGWTYADDTPGVVVVYDFGGDDAAESSADAVRGVWEDGTLTTGQPVSDMVEVQDVTAADRHVVVELTPNQPSGLGGVFSMMHRGEVVFQHQ